MAVLIACIYLCIRRGNAFAPDITSPVRLRRWAAACLAIAFLSHIWWIFPYSYSCDTNSVLYTVTSVLDCIGILTTIAGTLFAMLQDRRRPVWPVLIAMIPFVVLRGLHIVYPDAFFLDIALAYILLFYVLFSVYMVYAVRQYGRWLRDNFADLEHKEVWLSHVLVMLVLILVISGLFDRGDLTIGYLVQFIELVLFCFLLWRVETLPQLENTSMEPMSGQPDPEMSQGTDLPPADEETQEQDRPLIPANVIKQLLEERCVGTQLYLQHDLTLQQLAQAVGTNRSYLSLFFSSHGTTYNAYINNLRINHFVCLYREAAATGQTITAQQLASDSGYRSYSTFSLAFKQRMGQTVTAWMREMDK
jgi:AraC-like DNA-binding protein